MSRATDALLHLFRAHATIDREALEADVDRLIRRYYGLAQLRLTDVLGDVMEVMRRHHLALPTPYALFFKTWTMLDGLVATIDPAASVAAYISSYVQGFIAQANSPLAWASCRPRESIRSWIGSSA